jgi:hypothetical protein
VLGAVVGGLNDHGRSRATIVNVRDPDAWPDLDHDPDTTVGMTGTCLHFASCNPLTGWQSVASRRQASWIAALLCSLRSALAGQPGRSSR